MLTLTTTSERILLHGESHKIGEVHDGRHRLMEQGRAWHHDAAAAITRFWNLILWAPNFRRRSA